MALPGIATDPQKRIAQLERQVQALNGVADAWCKLAAENGREVDRLRALAGRAAVYVTLWAAHHDGALIAIVDELNAEERRGRETRYGEPE